MLQGVGLGSTWLRFTGSTVRPWGLGLSGEALWVITKCNIDAIGFKMYIRFRLLDLRFRISF